LRRTPDVAGAIAMMASHYVDEYLLPTERRVIRLRHHVAYILQDLVPTVLFLAVIIGTQSYLARSVLADNVTFYLAVVAMLRLSIIAALWWTERIIITDKRVMLARGLVVTRVSMMPLSKVTDLTFEQGLRGRLFKFGSVIIESAGQIPALGRIDFVPQSEEVYDALSELIFGERVPRVRGRSPRVVARKA
jgi:uncharacterized membrane protein YdbT with pleckstrin-like domain